MTTGFGNEEARDAVRRTLKGGGSGRITVFVMVAVFQALGIWTGNLLIIVPSAVLTVLAAAALVRAWRSSLAARRLGRGRPR